MSRSEQEIGEREHQEYLLHEDANRPRDLDPIRVRESEGSMYLVIDWDTRVPQSPLFRTITPEDAVALATALLVTAAKVQGKR